MRLQFFFSEINSAGQLAQFLPRRVVRGRRKSSTISSVLFCATGHVHRFAQQNVLLHDVSLEAEPCQIQTGATVSVIGKVSWSQERRAQPRAEIRSTTRTSPRCKPKRLIRLSCVLGSHPWPFFFKGPWVPIPGCFSSWVLGSQSLVFFCYFTQTGVTVSVTVVVPGFQE